MRFTILCVLGGVVGATAATTCAADNCLRAVRASAMPTRSGTADCSSFFETTVTPATSTFTATVTTTVTTTDLSNKRRRNNGAMVEARAPEPTLAARQVTVVPSSIPTYASACSGSARYSSACSCIGVTAMTTTVAAPSTTSTTTVTVTVSVPASAPTLAFDGFYTGDCSGAPVDGDGGSFVEGQCLLLPVQISILEDGFSAGTCAGATAADCSLVFYSDENCQEFEHSAPATPGCQFVGFDFSGQLICPACS